MQPRKILVQGRDGLMYESGIGQLPNGQYCSCQKTPGFVPNRPGNFGQNFLQLSPQAYNQVLQQVQGGASTMNNSFGVTNLPNMGNVGVARLDTPASPAKGAEVYRLLLDNTAGAAAARQIIGDYSGTYVLNGNTEVTPAGFVVGGTWTTNSKSQFAIQTFGRPWRLSKIQMIAAHVTDPELAGQFFSLTNMFYYDQGPTSNAPVKDNMTPTTLLSADQFKPQIQWYDKAVMFNGFNGIDVTIPIGYSITFQFIIESVGVASDQVLVGSR